MRPKRFLAIALSCCCGQGVLLFTEQGKAFAGAWTQAKGDGYRATSVSRERGDFGESWRHESYLEYGLTPRYTLSGKLETLWRLDAQFSDRTTGELSIRRQLYRTENSVVSIQAGALLGEALEGDTCEGEGGEVRLSYGRNLNLSGKAAYVVVAAAHRKRGTCDRNKVDFAVGVDLSENWNVQVKAFGETGGGDSLKLETMLSQKIRESYLGIGVREEVGGQFNETGVFVSLWKRF